MWCLFMHGKLTSLEADANQELADPAASCVSALMSNANLIRREQWGKKNNLFILYNARGQL